MGIAVLLLGYTSLGCAPAVASKGGLAPKTAAPKASIAESQSQADLELQAMRDAIARDGRFRTTFETKRSELARHLTTKMAVPVPKDAGGGYTHERHKLNYRLMYDAGNLYRLTGNREYANFIGKGLLAYASLYPTLPIHPKKKNSNSGKLFWQGLNEAVWLVHTIQAYEAVQNALSAADRKAIETGVLRPMARFLSHESPQTFNRIHNHATWATCAVGMTGYVLGEREWVEQALLGLDKSGRGGFMRQLDELFSPDGYYNEGPYYQRYALLPFVTFAQSIERNEPGRKIFEHREGILMRAIYATVELSYNRLLFPLNDAIKSKGIDTNELVHGVAVAYGRTNDPRLLDIAEQQGKTLLTRNGFRVAQALEDNRARPFRFDSRVFSDGQNGDEGALVVMRQPKADGPAVVFKATSQGGGHGHFDKLGLQFYDQGAEILSDYGAARFLNIEAKAGGRYLPENTTWAKQTVAHNTLVVDGVSHFGGQFEVARDKHPTLLFFNKASGATIAAAKVTDAYEGVDFTRTVALLGAADDDKTLVVDLMRVESDEAHRYDLPTHYQGQWIGSSFPIEGAKTALRPLGESHGYQHLWLRAQATPKDSLASATFLNDNGRFYSYAALIQPNTQLLLTELGANDPNLNLRRENGIVVRVSDAKTHDFVSVLEPHGEYNPAEEYTRNAQSHITGLEHARDADAEAVAVSFDDGARWVLAFSTGASEPKNGQTTEITIAGQSYRFSGRARVFRSDSK